MATNFPTSLDAFPAAATLATHTLGTDPHSTLHGNLGDALAAVQAKVGVDASAVPASLDYQVKRAGLVCGRLTLTSGTPVTAGDVTGATTAYFTPYQGNSAALYDPGSGKWLRYTFAEASVSLSGLTNLVPADVFGHWTGSALGLEVVNWTNGTTRATALATQDGVYVKSGDATRLYLGTVCGSGSGTCEDSVLRRFVYNNYNRALRKLAVVESTNNWTYNTAVTRPLNGSTANRVQVVSGTGEDLAEILAVVQLTANSTGSIAGYVGIGLDSTTTFTIDFGSHASVSNGVYDTPFVILRNNTPVGFHYYQALEYGAGTADTMTWFGQGLSGIGGFYSA